MTTGISSLTIQATIAKILMKYNSPMRIYTAPCCISYLPALNAILYGTSQVNYYLLKFPNITFEEFLEVSVLHEIGHSHCKLPSGICRRNLSREALIDHEKDAWLIADTMLEQPTPNYELLKDFALYTYANKDSAKTLLATNYVKWLCDNHKDKIKELPLSIYAAKKLKYRKYNAKRSKKDLIATIERYLSTRIGVSPYWNGFSEHHILAVSTSTDKYIVHIAGGKRHNDVIGAYKIIQLTT